LPEAFDDCPASKTAHTPQVVFGQSQQVQYRLSYQILGPSAIIALMAFDTKFFVAEPHQNTEADHPGSNTSLTLAYRTAGDITDPCVLIPTCFGGRIRNTFPWLYTNGDPNVPPVLAKYFVIVVGMLGGGESSSPSNAHLSMRGLNFPKVSIADNIHLQHTLCRALGINKLAAYIGNSMGGIQAYHMGVMYPDFVERLVVLTGAASASWHNISFLDGPKAALVNSVDFNDGRYVSPADRGTGAFGRVYSTWALSSAWFRAKKWEELGYTSMSHYLESKWETSFRKWDAHDLLCMLDMWQRADVSLHGPVVGDLRQALASIKAIVMVMPSRTDLYFPPEDSMEEVKHLQHGELRVIETVWGHVCGSGGGSKEDTKFIKSCIQELLAREGNQE
jgi:homoserine acetyltransferase